MGVGIYYFYHGFGLKAFERRHIRIGTILSIVREITQIWSVQNVYCYFWRKSEYRIKTTDLSLYKSVVNLKV